MIWSCCGARTKNIQFEFENGTMVRASSFDSAMSKLRTPIGGMKATKSSNDLWTVSFGPDVFTEIKSSTLAEAERVGGWRKYLDRRDPSVVRTSVLT